MTDNVCPACEIGNTTPVLYTSVMWFGKVIGLEGNYCTTCGETSIESAQALRNDMKYDAVRDAAGVMPGTPSPHADLGAFEYQIDCLHNYATNLVNRGDLGAARNINTAAYYLERCVTWQRERDAALLSTLKASKST